MEKKRPFDLEIIVPVLLGVFSLAGICVVLGYGIFNKAAPTPMPSATQFLFEFIGTEPGLSTQTPEITPTPEETSTPIVLDTPAPPVIVKPSNTPFSLVLKPTITPTIPSVLLKVDDTDYSMLYSGNWEAQANVNGAYLNTLHISLNVGNTVSYTFTGQQVIVSYQAGPSLGSISINLDGLVFQADQSSPVTQIQSWQSQLLVKATHTLRIEHLAGGSVNIDSITIPDTSTPTPTITTTP